MSTPGSTPARRDRDIEAKEGLNELLQEDPAASEDARVSERVAQILRDGERAALDRVVDTATRRDRPDLVFALNEAIEAFPLHELLSEMCGERLGRRASLGELDDEPSEALSTWWRAHRGRLTWDGARRRFLLGQ